jgi:hypothetical protein
MGSPTQPGAAPVQSPGLLRRILPDSLAALRRRVLASLFIVTGISVAASMIARSSLPVLDLFIYAPVGIWVAVACGELEDLLEARRSGSRARYAFAALWTTAVLAGTAVFFGYMEWVLFIR